MNATLHAMTTVRHNIISRRWRNRATGRVETDDHGTVALRLHATRVVTVVHDDRDGSPVGLSLDSGGWTTVTTQARMNECLWGTGLSVQRHARDGGFTLHGLCRPVPFARRLHIPVRFDETGYVIVDGAGRNLDS
jgi:hypothetical protein